MRYAYALTTALLLGGTAATMALHQPAGAQTAQNEPGAIQASVPRAGAPLSFADMVERLQPAVVNISTTQRVQVQANPFAGSPLGDLFGFGQGGGGTQTRQATSLGSGFIISNDGYIVTNNHVIAPGARGATVESITVTLADRRQFKAKLIGRDPSSDLAVLKIEGKGLPFVKFGDSTKARVGDWVVAIGEPYGLGGTVTAGIISAVKRATGQGGAYDRFIQTDASINQGNSGGPMFDLQGNVIGINSQILSPTGGNVGIGFAIPAEEARPIVEKLIAGKAIERGYLGVVMQEVTPDIAKALGVPEDRGTLVSNVEPGGAADKAGIKNGDVIVKVGDQDVTPDNTLSYLVANTPPGSRVTLQVIRDGKPRSVAVTVGTRPAEDQLAGLNGDDDSQGQGGDVPAQAAAGALGLDVAPLNPRYAQQLGVDPSRGGLVVLNVDPSSDAATKVTAGDLILSIDRQAVNTTSDASRLLQAAKRDGRTEVLLYLVRRNVGRYAVVTLAS